MEFIKGEVVLDDLGYAIAVMWPIKSMKNEFFQPWRGKIIKTGVVTRMDSREEIIQWITDSIPNGGKL
jgi:hypothetical protein